MTGPGGVVQALSFQLQAKQFNLKAVLSVLVFPFSPVVPNQHHRQDYADQRGQLAYVVGNPVESRTDPGADGRGRRARADLCVVHEVR